MNLRANACTIITMALLWCVILMPTVAEAEVAVVESVKAASDIYAPVAGTIRAVNNQLDEAPELVNESPYDDAWFFVIEPADPNAFDGLLTAGAYEALCEASDH